MMLPFIGTHDFCKSSKETLFGQTAVILLKTTETEFTFLGLIKLYPQHLQSKEVSTFHQNSGRMSRV